MVFGGSKLSLMKPGTVVRPHTGKSNARLRIHMGIIVPDNVYLRVNNVTKTWTEGKCIVIDDSYVHDVWHEGDTSRLVLIVDVWHLDMTEEQRLDAIRRESEDYVNMYQRHRKNPRMVLQMQGVPPQVLPDDFVYDQRNK